MEQLVTLGAPKAPERAVELTGRRHLQVRRARCCRGRPFAGSSYGCTPRWLLGVLL